MNGVKNRKNFNQLENNSQLNTGNKHPDHNKEQIHTFTLMSRSRILQEEAIISYQIHKVKF